MFQELEGMINQNNKLFLSDVSDEEESSATRIPKMSPRKRGSLSVPKDLQSPRSMGQKRRKVSKKSSRPAGKPQQPRTRAQKIQSGDRVKVVRGAKKKFLSRLGTVEKFQFKKQKWGILLDDGSKICLGDDCMQVVSKRKRTKTPDAQEPRKSVTLPGMSSFKNLKVAACNAKEIKEYKNSFAGSIRPKNSLQTAVIACVAGRSDVIKGLILTGKVDVNAHYETEGLEKTLAHICIEHGHTDCALMLLEMCLLVDARDGNGRTPLMLAADRGQLAVVRAFEQAGANVNACDNMKSNALMYAAHNTHPEVVEFLLECNADVDVTDASNKNALAYAMSKNDAPHKRMVDAIIKKMYQKNLVVDSAEPTMLPPRTSSLRIKRSTVPRVRFSREFSS